MRPLALIKLISFTVYSSLFLTSQLVYAQSPVAADVIVVIDESGSMSGEQTWIRDAIPFLEDSLKSFGVGSESQQNLYGLVGYGNRQVAPRSLNVGTGLLGSATEFTTAANSLVTSGGTEDGWRGIQYALEQYPRRNGAAVNIILATDEDRDNTNNAITYQTVLEALNTNRALLNAVVNARIRCEDGTPALGMDSQGNGYIADGTGGFTTCTNPRATNGSGRTIADYVDLALENGGAVWDLSFLRSGGTNAQSFTAALLAIKVDEILNQRPIGDLVAVAQATPNPALVGQTITLDGSNSFHQLDNRSIVSWEWDLDNDGIFDAAGPIITTSFAALGDYPVKLRVTDDSSTPLTAEADIVINVNIPPLEPTADASGPYLFCPQNTPWRLDGRASINPDDGLSEAGLPVDAITAYDWDIDNDLIYGDVSGALVDATSQLSALGVGDHIIRLRVTDNTAISFPSSGLANLTDTQVTQVRIRDASDALCNCLSDLAARPKMTKVQLTWTDSNAASYAVSRSTTQGGPYERIAVTDNRYSTYLDTGLELDTTYYYVVEELAGNGQAICRSREISATPAARRINLRNRPPVITSTPITQATEGLAYNYDVDATDPDRREQLTYTLEVAPTGMTIDAVTGQIAWTPINAQVGEQVIVVRVIDNQGDFVEQIFAINVSNVNQAPVISSTPDLVATELQAYTYQVIAVDPDLDDTLSYTLITAPTGMTIDASTGLISWTPQVGQQGNSNVNVSVQDAAGLSDTQAFTIAVSELNLLPNITSSPEVTATATQLYNYQVTASDGNNDALTYSLGVFPEGMVIEPLTGLISWTPTEAQIGSQQVTVIVTDARGGAGSQTFTLLVRELNVAPVIDTTTLPDALEDQLYVQTLLASDPNVGDVLAYTLTAGPNSLTIDPGTGEIRWLPVSNNVGNNTVTFRVTDAGGLFAERTFTINVANVNDAPLIVSEPALTANPDVLYSYQVNASDADGDVLTFTLTQVPAGMSIDAAAGLIEWTPLATQSGTQQVTVRVTDSGGLFVEQNFSIIVGAGTQPLAPEILSLPSTTALANATYQYQVIANDPNNDALSYSLDIAPQGLTINANNGLINWIPDDTQLGAQAVTVRVTDPGGLFDTQSFVINVSDIPANNPPSIDSIPDTTAGVGVAYSYDVDASDSDGNTLTYGLDSAPDGMTIDSDTGLINWTPTTDQQGVNDVVIRVEDGSGAYATQIFSITVGTGLINQSPVITSVPLLTATINNEYRYNAVASDADGDAISYSLSNNPSGMLIDGVTGEISWIPNTTQLGLNTVELVAADGNGGSATQLFSISVGGATGDLSPVITTLPDTTASTNIAYSYDVDAVDPQGNPVTYILDTAPVGMSINSATGEVSWLPQATQIGSNDVVIRSTSQTGEFSTQTFAITVDGAVVNQSPVITSTPTLNAKAGEAYTYSVVASDADADTLSFGLSVFPDGMTINSGTGVINWTPAQSQVGENAVEVNVLDTNGGVATQVFTIVVSESLLVANDAERPIVIINLSVDTAAVSDDVTISVTAIDNTGVVAQELLIDGNPIVLNAGQATFSSAIAGIFNVEASATDAAGNQGSASAELKFITNSGDTVPPVVSITSPAESATLTEATDIIGTVSDNNLSRYIVEYSKQGENEYLRLTEQSTAVNEGVLASFDPTMLRNGFYDIRVTAEDTDGNTSTASTIYEADGEAKVGNFSMQITDLDIPLAGLPIEVVRKYDSRDRSKGDFGYGWSLEINNIQISENGLIGLGWQQTVTSSFLFPVYNLSATRDHKVTVTFSDGRVDEFGVRLNPSSSTLFPFGLLIGTNIEFFPLDDTTSSLIALDDTRATPEINGSSVRLLDDLFGSNVLNPTRYQLTTADGTVYIINQNTGLESLTDVSGNTLTVGRNGIIHSSGRSVIFTRDSQDRITRITDPNGNSISYEYDFYGDLVASTDRVGSRVKFTYNSSHGLLDVIDPSGNKAARNEYDDDGRLVAVIDSQGNRTEISSDISGRQQITRDRRGNVTVLAYDALGNVISETNALGHTTTFNYDSNGNQISETDPLGRITAKSYDARGNILSETDALGNTKSFVYDAQNRLVETTDLQGGITVYVYDNRNNLTSVTDAAGNITSYTYDSRGNNTSVVNKDGSIRSFVYDAFGNLEQSIDENGVASTLTYDSNGNPRTVTTNRTDALGNTRPMTWTRIYDAQDRLIETIDPSGKRAITTYNALGLKSSETDANGNIKQYVYDSIGNLIQVNFPDGTTEQFTYDEEGNQITSTDRSGNTTLFEYDAVNQLISTTFADGATQTQEYDAAGQLIAKVDANGNRTQYEYDALGRKVREINALGGETLTTYDLVGNLISTRDPNGNAVTHEYDVLSNRTKTIYPDGGEQVYGYDETGKTTAVINEINSVTSYTYDALGEQTSVVDALGNTTISSYDEIGNLIARTDGNGNQQTWQYNDSNEVTSHQLPLGMDDARTYDANGNVITRQDWNGNTITFEYDALNRLLRKDKGNGDVATYTYTPTGKQLTAADNQGLVRYQYDNRDRLVQITQADGEIIQYEYDAVGNRTRLITAAGASVYSYDALNRMSSVTDNAANTTSYQYDAAGNLINTTYANGNIETLTYDSRNRMLSREQRTATSALIASFVYTYDAVGNRLSVSEQPSGRQVNYQYDALSRLIEEQITDVLLGNETIQYTYDATGNRLSKTDSNGVITYTYDANGRLINDGVSAYAYDANGNTISKNNPASSAIYAYDTEDRLTQADIDGVVSGFTYDANHIRTSKTVDGVTENYLVDTNRAYAEVIDEQQNGVLNKHYTHGLELVSQQQGTAISYYHQDGIGSTRVLSDTAGQQLATYQYDSFGHLQASSGAVDNRYLFTGEEYDPSIDAYNLRARYYQPSIGRFITRDPFMTTDNTEEFNRYIYAENNPLRFIDPSGNTTLAYTAITINISIRQIVALAAIAYAIQCNAYYIATTLSPDIAVPAAFAACKAGKWTCNTKCYYYAVNDSSKGIVGFVNGTGSGNSPGVAWGFAQSDANSKIPVGFNKRHCKPCQAGINCFKK